MPKRNCRSPVNASIGQRIFQMRRVLHLTQEKVAEIAGMSLQTLKRIEHGEDSMLGNYVHIAQALGISWEYLATGIDPAAEIEAQKPIRVQIDHNVLNELYALFQKYQIENDPHA